MLAPVVKALTVTPGLLPPPPAPPLPLHPFLPFSVLTYLSLLCLHLTEAAATDAQAASKQSNGVKARVSGKDAFVLYDTYGFPLEITQELAAAQSVDVDVEGFTHQMQVCFPFCLSPGSLVLEPSSPCVHPHPNLPPQPSTPTRFVSALLFRPPNPTPHLAARPRMGYSQ